MKIDEFRQEFPEIAIERIVDRRRSLDAAIAGQPPCDIYLIDAVGVVVPLGTSVGELVRFSPNEHERAANSTSRRTQ